MQVQLTDPNPGAEPVQNANKQLYCACLIFNRPDGSYPKEEYFHADSLVHARALIRVQYPNPRRVTILEVGPVVGYFANDDEDKHGKLYHV